MLWRIVRRSRAISCLQRSSLQSARHNSSLESEGFAPYSRSHQRAAADALPSNERQTEEFEIAKIEILRPGKAEALPVARLVDLLNTPPANKPIRVAGLVQSIRKQKRVAFAKIDDGSTHTAAQAVLTPEQAEKISNGSYVDLAGEWKKSRGGEQDCELSVSCVTSISECDGDSYPIQKKSMGLEHLRNHPHLRLRLPQHSLVQRVRAQLIASIHKFYAGLNKSDHNRTDHVLFVQPPLVTSSDCEGAGEVFTVSPKLRETPHAASTIAQGQGQNQLAQPHYFGDPKYLTVSSQLHLEAYSAALGNVWALSPTFRAEESDTNRHLAEFYMLEAEFRNTTDLEDICTRAGKLIRHCVKSIAQSDIGSDVKNSFVAQHIIKPEVGLSERWKAIFRDDSAWLTMTYTQAIQLLENAYDRNPSLFEHKPNWETGLALEHEKWLVKSPGRNTPLFVTHYPKVQKPFYMMCSSGDTTDPRATVECFDLLLPYGTCEIAGGSLREHRLEHLIENMRGKGLLGKTSDGKEQNYPYLQHGESLGGLKWYADLRRYGSSSHGGFGIGFDRLLMYITGINNVRETVAFPRVWKSCVA